MQAKLQGNYPMIVNSVTLKKYQSKFTILAV